MRTPNVREEGEGKMRTGGIGKILRISFMDGCNNGYIEGIQRIPYDDGIKQVQQGIGYGLGYSLQVRVGGIVRVQV